MRKTILAAVMRRAQSQPGRRISHGRIYGRERLKTEHQVAVARQILNWNPARHVEIRAGRSLVKIPMGHRSGLREGGKRENTRHSHQTK